MSSPFSFSEGKPLEQLKVTELKEELKKRKLSLKGVKKDLLERLEEAIKKEQSNAAEGGSSHETNQVLIDSGFHDGEFSPQASAQVLMVRNLDDRSQQKHEDGEADAGASKTALQDNGLDDTNQEEVYDALHHEEKREFDANEVHDEAVGLHHVDVQEKSAMEISSVSIERSLEEPTQQEELQRSDYNEVKVDVLYSSDVTTEVKDDNLPFSSNLTDDIKEELSLSHNAHNDVKDEVPVADDISHASVDVTQSIASNITDLANVSDVLMETKVDEMASVSLADVNDNAVEYVSTDGDVTSQGDLPSSVTRHDRDIDIQVSDTKESIVLEADAKGSVDDHAMEDAEALDALREDPKNRVENLNEGVPNVPNVSVENEPAIEIEALKHQSITDEVAKDEEKHTVGYEAGIGNSTYSAETSNHEIKKEDIGEQKGDAMDIEKLEGGSGLPKPEKSQDLCDDTKHVQTTYEDEIRGGRVSEDDWRKDMKDLDKLITDHAGIQAGQKRKDDASDYKQQEPAKRVRKWNSGNELQAGTNKPLTMDIVKEITSAEAKPGASVGVSRSSPKTITTSKPLVTVAKSEPDTNGAKREVPPPSIPPTTSLKIERFVRPFTLKAVRDMLAEYGQCVDFWMDQIKTHCYITYSAVDEATAARNGLYHKQWPPSFGNLLVAEFVDPSEVKAKCKGVPEKVTVNNTPLASIPQGTTATNNNISQAAQPVYKASSHGHPNVLPPPPPLRERIPPPPVHRAEPEPQVPTLDDLFFKTKAKPHIYYLPLTDEQVAQKVAMKRTNDHERQLNNMKPSARA